MNPIFKSNIRDSLSLTDSDNEFQTFAKLGIWQGINSLRRRDILKILSGYREIILVDFSNIIRNIAFLGSMQYLGYNVSQFIDLDKQIIPYENFQYILPMLIDLLKLFSHNRIFLIYMRKQLFQRRGTRSHQLLSKRRPPNDAGRFQP